MQIYRVESRLCRQGPYRHEITGCPKLVGWETLITPSPHNDGLDHLAEDDRVCGFDSIQKYRDWFTSADITQMLSWPVEFVLGVHYVNLRDIQVGNKQVVFVQNKATHRYDLHLKTLERLSNVVQPFRIAA